jgi:hypothetical protein
MRNIAAEPLKRPSAPSQTRSDNPVRKVQPAELVGWLLEKGPAITRRWSRELKSRYESPSTGVNGLLDQFLSTLVRFLPGMLGPYREQVEVVWIRASELFGAVAARRGLAAGEVIEEFQILREALIRQLYLDPPLGGQGEMSLRELLRLNRVIDTGVTHASVGHTDALFFALFEGSGIPDAPPTAGLKTEVRSQLQGLEDELRDIVGLSSVEGSPEVESEGH